MQYRAKPVIKQAIKYDGMNLDKVMDFIGDPEGKNQYWACITGGIAIQTLEGIMTALIGDYIIKGLQGEFYPCKPDIFEASYEKVEE